MGFEDTNQSEDRGSDGALSFLASLVSCSICLEAVNDNGDRSTAKLQCGHEFHLDCIGSAFNAKGLMQCPNCRKIEEGQWLYANGCHSYPEFSMDEWTHEEDLYDLNYPEMTIGLQWCPFSTVTRFPSSFEEVESPSTAYHDLLGHHTIFTEHTTASSAGHSCPYVAYIQPLQPSSSSNSPETAGDGPTFHHHWSSLSGRTDIPTSHAFHGVDLPYHNWDPTSSRVNGTAQASFSSATRRSTRGDSDGLPSAGSFAHPFLFAHGSGSGAGSSSFSSVAAPDLSNSHGQAQVHGLHGYHQQPSSTGTRAPMFSGVRRPTTGPRGLAPGPPLSSPDHTGFYMFPSRSTGQRNIQDAENTIESRFYAWERDQFTPYPLVPVDRESSWWRAFQHPPPNASDSGSRTGLWHRHGSSRPSSQRRTENSSYQAVPCPQMHPFM